MDGTSAAAPFVAGAFALLKAEFPNEPYNSLIARLLAATDKCSSLERTTISGGRLNIFTALTAPFKPLPPITRTWNEWLDSLIKDIPFSDEF